MKRMLLPLLALAVAAGLLVHYGKFDLSQLGSLGLPASTGGPTARGTSSGTIRVATYNIQVLGEAKLAQPEVVRRLVELIRRFDVVAIQEVRSKSQDILPRLVEAINADGSRYDYVIGPRLGRSETREQYAVIYNTATLEADAAALYTVNDPDDLLHREPLVVAFRALGPPGEEAFTFTLINVHVDPDEVEAELAVLDDVYRAVRADGRQEDDVLLLGDFNAGPEKLSPLMAAVEAVALVVDQPTMARGGASNDQILASRTATREFTGRSGVVDVMREFNLTLDETLAISDHLPVWAEFDLREGGRQGRVAGGAGEVVR